MKLQLFTVTVSALLSSNIPAALATKTSIGNDPKEANHLRYKNLRTQNPPALTGADGAALGDDSATVLDRFPWTAAVPGIDSPSSINGRVPEGTPGPPLLSRIISASSIGEEELTIVFREVRSPGSRAPIHVHRYAGTTCVNQGAMKVYIEGQEEFIAEEGSCYVMPAMTKIAAFNIAKIDSIVNDVFRLPCGEPTITFIESCCLELNAVDDSFKMYSTSSGQMMDGCDDLFDFAPHYEELSAYEQNVKCDHQGTVPLSSSGSRMVVTPRRKDF